MQKNEVCGCCGARRPDSRSLVILTPAEAEKAALNDSDLFWTTKAEGLLAQVKADMEQADREGKTKG